MEKAEEKRNIWMGLRDLVYPPKCVLCGDFLHGDEKELCRKCVGSLPVTNACNCFQYGIQFTDCLSALYYRPIRRSFLRYKFEGRWHYSSTYSRWMIQCLGQYGRDIHCDVVTWVPLNRIRRMKRGFDQTELIARPVARYLGMELTPTLVKCRSIRAQSHLEDASLRWKNIRGAFAVKQGASGMIQGKRILLIDDLITTGATLEEAAGVLMAAGAAEVRCLTLARGGEHFS